MLNPFLLMAVFYLVVALIGAVDAALTSFTLLPWFVGLPWLRIHFITLGVFTEAAFGVLPAFVSARAGTAKPSTRWDIWLILNAGLVVLLAGIPSINRALIITGGTLVFVAVTLLIVQLRSLGTGQSKGSGSLKFYLAGLAYLLVGILVGTGLWVGWNEPLRLGVPKEVHIHANSWGFASLVFAGLLIDLLPALTGVSLAGRRTLAAIFWSMSLGALGLVLGPWMNGNLVVMVPGLVLHVVATVWLLVLIVQSLQRHGLFASAGAWHLVVSYVWILLPVLVAPLIILGVSGIPGADIEATAPQALIYGWMLQFLYAVAPYFTARWLLHNEKARLGGNWLSLITVNLGGIFIWASIFLLDVRDPLHAIAYVLFGVSLVAAAWETGAITLAALRRAELREAQTA
jgi:cytochrome c oxidase cbb3-type subunit I